MDVPYRQVEVKQSIFGLYTVSNQVVLHEKITVKSKFGLSFNI